MKRRHLRPPDTVPYRNSPRAHGTRGWFDPNVSWSGLRDAHQGRALPNHVRVQSWGASIAVLAPGRATDPLPLLLEPNAAVNTVSDGFDPSGRVDATVTAKRTEHGWQIVGDVGTSWRGVGDDPTARADVARRLASEVHLAIAAHADGVTFIHAGAVAWRGAGVILPGTSRAGKSTLVHALLLAGASYLSDEYAVLDHAGHMHPYTKPLAIREPTGTKLVQPERIGTVATKPVPVRAVVHTRYTKGATWTPRHARGAEVVIPLVANAVAAQLAPLDVTANTVAVASRDAVLFDGPRGEADHTAHAILAAIDELLEPNQNHPR